MIIYLTGPPFSGKTSMCNILFRRYGWGMVLEPPIPQCYAFESGDERQKAIDNVWSCLEDFVYKGTNKSVPVVFDGGNVQATLFSMLLGCVTDELGALRIAELVRKDPQTYLLFLQEKWEDENTRLPITYYPNDFGEDLEMVAKAVQAKAEGRFEFIFVRDRAKAMKWVEKEIIKKQILKIGAEKAEK